jgi:hypothetical protein
MSIGGVILNFNDILNGTIVTLLSALIIAIVSGIYKLFKKNFTENTRLFMIKLKFYLCLIFVIFDAYILGQYGFQYFLLNLLPLLVIVACCIIAFYEALKYNNNNSK